MIFVLTTKKNFDKFTIFAKLGKTNYSLGYEPQIRLDTHREHMDLIFVTNLVFTLALSVLSYGIHLFCMTFKGRQSRFYLFVQHLSIFLL